ncbi:hypothetical protein [Chryseobacterium sp. 52]|uniref:hypothetical protein n=1 Tax=Chryseobacterium sp. 52 TaxID=2035213 RepID=UPI00117BF609|nr:hypothetical protein [Chryseobacterium sp. 52]
MPIQILNPATDETLNYFPVTNFLHDNQPITSSGIINDGVLYIEQSGLFYVLEDFMGGNPINARRFGASNSLGDRGYTSTAINKAINLAKNYNYKSLYIPSGNYDISETINIDVTDDTIIKIDGQLILNSEFAGIGIIVGQSNKYLSGLNIQGLNCSVEKDYSDPIGIKIMNIIFSTIEIKRITGFNIGALLYSDSENGGISYNSFYLNYLHNNTTNLKFEKADTAGYINENIFYGGSFNHTSEFPKKQTYHIHMLHNPENSNPYNNNRFFYPSFEDNDKDYAVAAIITGDSNTIVNPRMENPKNSQYQIVLDEHSIRCQILSKGFVLNENSIDDKGKENSYETNTGSFLRTNSTNPVLTLQNGASSSLKLYSGLDASTPNPNEVFFVTGEGKGYYSHSIYVEQGIRWVSSDGSRNDRGLFSGTGDPTVTANPGSLYVNNNGGDIMLWVKTSGGSSAGWKPIGTQAAPLTAPVPPSPVNAQDVWARLEDLENKLKASGLLSS